jgi:hypothetical protein
MLNIHIQAADKADAEAQLLQQLSRLSQKNSPHAPDAPLIMTFAKGYLARLSVYPNSNIFLSVVGSLTGRINGQDGDYLTGSDFSMKISQKPKEGV